MVKLSRLNISAVIIHTLPLCNQVGDSLYKVKENTLILRGVAERERERERESERARGGERERENIRFNNIIFSMFHGNIPPAGVYLHYEVLFPETWDYWSDL